MGNGKVIRLNDDSLKLIDEIRHKLLRSYNLEAYPKDFIPDYKIIREALTRYSALLTCDIEEDLT